MSVCLSACMNSAPTGRIFTKFETLDKIRQKYRSLYMKT